LPIFGESNVGRLPANFENFGRTFSALFLECSPRCWPSTRKTSLCRTRSPSASTACSATSSPCGQTEQRRQQQLGNETAKLIIYRAFIEGDLQAPKRTAPCVSPSLPAAQAVGLGDKLGWRTFRRTYSSLLRQLGVDLKVQQELMRHAHIRTTMNLYTDSFSEDLRIAHSLVVRQILPQLFSAA
jgi:hypothetical protein